MAVAVHATAAELDAIVDVVTRAFSDDPVMVWANAPAPDPQASLRELMSFLVPRYFALGHLHLVHGPSGVVGAGLWAPPDRAALSEDTIEAFLAAMGPHLGDHLAERFGALSRTEEFRPSEPHLYLGVLAVDPDVQSKGHGGALVTPVLAECDRMGLLAHLESSNPRNIPFYRRHGFEETEAFVVGGGDGPVMTIMSRQPR